MSALESCPERIAGAEAELEEGVKAEATDDDMEKGLVLDEFVLVTDTRRY